MNYRAGIQNTSLLYITKPAEECPYSSGLDLSWKVKEETLEIIQSALYCSISHFTDDQTSQRKGVFALSSMLLWGSLAEIRVL